MSLVLMAWRNLSRRKLRTGLTVAGIAVGVALILVLLSLVAGIDVQVKSSIRSLGGVDITVYNSTITNARQTFLLGSSATLNESMVNDIARTPNVYAVSPQSTEVVLVNGTLAPIWGIDPATYDKVSTGLNIVQGREIAQNDNQVAVLGIGLQQLFNASLNDHVVVQGRPSYNSNNYTLTVIGTYETGVTLTDRGIYVSIGVLQNLTDSSGQVTSILVKVDDPNNIDAVSSEISGLFPDVRVVTISNVAAQASQLLNTLTLFFAALGIVALVTGSFGVINTMLISVVERTREIGTLKAIGASENTVLRMFIIEAVILGCLGAAAGAAVGSLSSFILAELSVRALPAVAGRATARISPVLTPTNLLISMSLGLATGVLAGLYPAWRAARMKPVEALRHG
jgi:putative ABC transport system permease protein